MVVGQLVVGIVADSTSLGFLLVGIGLLCFGMGVGWWRVRRDPDREQTDRDRPTPNRGDENERDQSTQSEWASDEVEADHTVEDTSSDTGGFVFNTEERELSENSEEGDPRI